MGRRKIPALRPEGCVDTNEAARLLGVSRATFFKYMKEPDFPEPEQRGRGGRPTWWRPEQLLAWKKRREEQGTQ